MINNMVPSTTTPFQIWPTAPREPEPRFCLPRPGQVHLWLFQQTGARWPAGDALGILDTHERQRARRYHFDRDRARFIVRHVTLRQILAAYTGIAPRDVGYAYNSYGKPELARGMAASELRFNLSHSADWVLLGLTSGPDVGVDIEAARELPEADHIVRTNFTPNEVATWDGLALDMRNDAFFAAWTRKEAVLKALGTGLSADLGRFEVTLDPDGPARLVAFDSESDAAERWSLESFQFIPGYWAAVATAKKDVVPALASRMQ